MCLSRTQEKEQDKGKQETRENKVQEKHHETQERDSSTNSIQQETQNQGKDTKRLQRFCYGSFSLFLWREYCVKVVLQLHPLSSSLSFGRMPDVTQKNTTFLPLKHDTLSLSWESREERWWQMTNCFHNWNHANCPLIFQRKESNWRHRLKEEEEEGRRGWRTRWFIFSQYLFLPNAIWLITSLASSSSSTLLKLICCSSSSSVHAAECDSDSVTWLVSSLLNALLIKEDEI